MSAEMINSEMFSCMLDIEMEDGIEIDDRRTHHNVLERKRRQTIKETFTNLKEVLPSLKGEKMVSRVLILKKAVEHIQIMHRRNKIHQQDIEDLRRENFILANQIQFLQRTHNVPYLGDPVPLDSSESDSGSEREVNRSNKTKKLTVAG